MKDMMSYKGYFGSVHYSDEDQVFHGKIEFIRGLVSYEGTDVNTIITDALERYLSIEGI